MNLRMVLRAACLSAAIGAALHARAESFTSSALSAGSASSGSVSNSLHGSSKSSTPDEKTADADYRITEIAQAPERAGIARVTLQADGPQQSMVLDLPRAVVDVQGLAQGDLVHAQQRVYGLEFSRGEEREAFYLVLADDWYAELAAHPVNL